MIRRIMKEQVEKQESGEIIRWYHLVALGVVAVLVVIALITFFHRFDISILSGKSTLKFASGCTSSLSGDTNELNYVYIGVNEGDMIAPGGIKVQDEESAILKIKKLEGRPVVEYRVTTSEEWTEMGLNFGEEGNFGSTIPSPDCSERIYFNLSI